MAEAPSPLNGRATSARPPNAAAARVFPTLANVLAAFAPSGCQLREHN